MLKYLKPFHLCHACRSSGKLNWYSITHLYSNILLLKDLKLTLFTITHLYILPFSVGKLGPSVLGTFTSSFNCIQGWLVKFQIALDFQQSLLRKPEITSEWLLFWKKFFDGTIPSNKKLYDVTVPSNKSFIVKLLFDVTLKMAKFKIWFQPTATNPRVVRTLRYKNCVQSFIEIDRTG